MDSREQFEMLSTVSNYHPLGFPSTQDPQKIKTPNISFMQLKHRRSHSLDSVKTFIGWFFGWLSTFKIDFRKEIDPYCGHNPKMLACDGTHISVSLQHLRLDNPVTKADINDQVPWLHGCVTHCLF